MEDHIPIRPDRSLLLGRQTSKWSYLMVILRLWLSNRRIYYTPFLGFTSMIIFIHDKVNATVQCKNNIFILNSSIKHNLISIVKDLMVNKSKS